MAPEDSHSTIPPPLFKIGELVFTEGVSRLMDQGRLDPWPYFLRHVRGDWGDVDDARRQHNADALSPQPIPLSSAYEIAPDITLWIITTWDRSVTTLLLPDEYEDD